MVGVMLAALATAWTVVAADVVIESTLDRSNRFLLFGRSLVDTTQPIEVFACVGLGMTVAVVVTAWIVRSTRRRDEALLRADVAGRWEEISTRNAGAEARNGLLEWRRQDLQDQVEALIGRRDELLVDTRRDLEDAKNAVRASRSRESLRQLQDGVIVLPELDPDAESEGAPGGGPEAAPGGRLGGAPGGGPEIADHARGSDQSPLPPDTITRFPS